MTFWPLLKMTQVDSSLCNKNNLCNKKHYFSSGVVELFTFFHVVLFFYVAIDKCNSMCQSICLSVHLSVCNFNFESCFWLALGASFMLGVVFLSSCTFKRYQNCWQWLTDSGVFKLRLFCFANGILVSCLREFFQQCKVGKY